MSGPEQSSIRYVWARRWIVYFQTAAKELLFTSAVTAACWLALYTLLCLWLLQLLLSYYYYYYYCCYYYSQCLHIISSLSDSSWHLWFTPSYYYFQFQFQWHTFPESLQVRS